MVNPYTVVLTVALLALLCLPCALVVAARSDNAALRRAWSSRGRCELLALHLLDRNLPGRAVPVPDTVPPIEQVVAELRRLDRQRHIGPTYGSEKWLAAVLRAYDEWLQLACRQLAVTQHLSRLDSIDRDIERLRVEGELAAAGLKIR